MEMTRHILVVSFVVILIVASLTNAFPKDKVEKEARERILSRTKRSMYVTFQDRAQSTCIGLCMYHEKRPYSKCLNKCRLGRIEDVNNKKQKIG